jgi:hypothetical protein
MAIMCNYIAASTGAGSISFTYNTTYLSSWVGTGGADASRYECFISGYCLIKTAIPAGAWTQIGTVNVAANGT